MKAQPFPLRLFILVMLFSYSLARLRSAEPEAAPDFELPRWRGGERVALASFAGKVVVLDFFAYWCPPCQKASAELEAKVQKYYEAKGGNPKGAPVQVVAINVEKDHPERTAAYIKKSGLTFVLDDGGGRTMERYGGSGLPLIVVIDGTRRKNGTATFEIAYRSDGFEGAEKIRKVIDRLGEGRTSAGLLRGNPFRDDRIVQVAALAADSAPGSVGADLDPAAVPPATGMANDAERRAEPAPEPAETPVERVLEIESEGLFASDALLTQSGLSYRETRPANQWGVSYSYATLGIDFVPVDFDFFHVPAEVSEERHAVQFSGRHRLWQPLTLMAAAGHYDGFSDYRSAWLNEYYRQQYAVFPEYREAEPNGQNLSFGARWEYRPTTGFLQANVTLAQDEIAPGYEIDFAGVRRGRDDLNTVSYSIAGENVLTRRVRVMNEFRLTHTSEREARYAYQGSVNVALGERWVWRTVGGYAQEDPQFEAWYVGGSLDYELTPAAILTVSGRYYVDTGEIENSLFSAAAPGVTAYQAGLGFRYLWPRSALKVYLAPYFTRYEPFGIGTQFFQGLYRDREWGIAQIAYSFRF